MSGATRGETDLGRMLASLQAELRDDAPAALAELAATHAA